MVRFLRVDLGRFFNALKIKDEHTSSLVIVSGSVIGVQAWLGSYESAFVTGTTFMALLFFHKLAVSGDNTENRILKHKY